MDPVEENLKIVNGNIKRAYDSIANNLNKFPILVAVSKIQPKEYIIRAYKYGQRHFGENYIQELYEKSTDLELQKECPEIKWHLIGHIQTNKINKLLNVPNLSFIQTVDSIKLAEALNSSVERHANIVGKVNVFVQINVSNETVKSGVYIDGATELVSFVINKCNRLQFCGLMTIGAYGYDVSLGPNPDFVNLDKARELISVNLNIPKSDIDLSMGMSADYEQAITLGSNLVRVGTSIFGERKTKPH